MNKIVYILGISVLLTDLILVTRIFFVAFLNQSYTYTININNFGEGTFEVVLSLLLFPFGFYILYEKIKEMYVEVKG